MIAVEERLIDEITATFHYLRTGKVPDPIPIPDDLPDNEIRQLLTYVNRFLVEFALFTEAMAQVAQGELDLRPLASRLAVTHSFKALQSNLKHLTWKTQQIAGGDLEQRVDFMGDFSIAFNTMTFHQPHLWLIRFSHRVRCAAADRGDDTAFVWSDQLT